MMDSERITVRRKRNKISRYHFHILMSYIPTSVNVFPMSVDVFRMSVGIVLTSVAHKKSEDQVLALKICQIKPAAMNPSPDG